MSQVENHQELRKHCQIAARKQYLKPKMSAEVEVKAQDGSMRLAKDLFSGAMGGIAQVLIGMFIDQDTSCRVSLRITDI